MLRLIESPAQEYALYRELEQRVSSSKFENIKVKGAHKSHLESQISEHTSNCQDEYQALLQRCTNFDSTVDEEPSPYPPPKRRKISHNDSGKGVEEADDEESFGDDWDDSETQSDSYTIMSETDEDEDEDSQGSQSDGDTVMAESVEDDNESREIISPIDAGTADPLIHPAGSPCEMIARTRRNEYENMRWLVKIQIEQLVWLEKNKRGDCNYFQQLKKRIEDDRLGDGDSTDEMLRFLEDAENQYEHTNWQKLFFKGGRDPAKHMSYMIPFPEASSEKSASNQPDKTVVDLRQHCLQLSRSINAFINHNRSLRYIESIVTLQRASRTSEEFDCSNCSGKIFGPSTATLNTTCGHIICPACALKDEKLECRVDRCLALNMQKIAGDTLGNGSAEASSYGTKLDGIIGNIKDVIGNGDKVLVFIQYDSTRHKLRRALHHSKIAFLDLCEMTKDRQEKRSEALLAFQNGTDLKARTKIAKAQKSKNPAMVLIMNIGNESAAGRYDYQVVSLTSTTLT